VAVKETYKSFVFAAMIWLSGPTSGIGADYENAGLGFVVTTNGRWSTADAATTKLLTQVTQQGAIAHARAKDVKASADTVDSAVLLVYSKLPLGAPGDNPNLILAKEKAWGEEYEKSGAGYLKLMQDRVKRLRAPTKFVGEAKLVKVGDVSFHQMDAINTKVPNAETKQRYICTFKDDYHVFFVLSFNDENDADFATMMDVVKSYRNVPHAKERG
jgi:hypothetical protein